MERISFNDLQAQQSRIRKEINSAINRVLEHGQYILGPEVVKLEKKLAEFTQATPLKRWKTRFKFSFVLGM